MRFEGEKAVVCGAGGFIGGHLVKSLIAQGVDVVRAVDIKPLGEWYQKTEGVENHRRYVAGLSAGRRYGWHGLH